MNIITFFVPTLIRHHALYSEQCTLTYCDIYHYALEHDLTLQKSKIENRTTVIKDLQTLAKMPFPTQPDCAFLSPVGFPIRMNNGEQETQASDQPQNSSFPSMLELGQSLPPSGALVEYVRNQPTSHQLHSAVAPSIHGIPQTTVRAVQQVNTPQYYAYPQQQMMSPQSYMLVHNNQPPHLRVAEAPRTQYLSPTSVSSGLNNSILSPTAPFWSPQGIFAEAIPQHPGHENEEGEENKSTTQLTEKFNQLALGDQQQQLQSIPSVCSHPECPVAEPHAEGLYQYDSRRWSFRSHEANHISRAAFGASSPSLTVYASLGRLAEGRGSLRDAVAVNAFQEAHYYALRVAR